MQFTGRFVLWPRGGLATMGVPQHSMTPVTLNKAGIENGRMISFASAPHVFSREKKARCNIFFYKLDQVILKCINLFFS